MAVHTEHLIRHATYRDLWLCCDPSLVSNTIRTSVTSGHYEWPGGERLLAVSRDGDRVLELGGGIGCLASLVSKHRRLESYDLFEANSSLGPAIIRTLSANHADNVRIHHSFLTDDPEILQRGAVEFFLDADFWGSSVKRRPTSVGSCSVPAEPLNEWITRIRPTVIHSDIEGAEDGLFDRALLDGVRAITVEIHEDVIGPDGRDRVLSTLRKKGFAADQSGPIGGVYAFSRG
jgi:FkbM family methyltransferase